MFLVTVLGVCCSNVGGGINGDDMDPGRVVPLQELAANVYANKIFKEECGGNLVLYSEWIKRNSDFLHWNSTLIKSFAQQLPYEPIFKEIEFDYPIKQIFSGHRHLVVFTRDKKLFFINLDLHVRGQEDLSFLFQPSLKGFISYLSEDYKKLTVECSDIGTVTMYDLENKQIVREFNREDMNNLSNDDSRIFRHNDQFNSLDSIFIDSKTLKWVKNGLLLTRICDKDTKTFYKNKNKEIFTVEYSLKSPTTLHLKEVSNTALSKPTRKNKSREEKIEELLLKGKQENQAFKRRDFYMERHKRSYLRTLDTLVGRSVAVSNILKN